jgi:hypothetical protein
MHISATQQQVLQTQAQQDQNSQELAISLRDMLAFANEACTLEKIKGGIDIIKEMGLAVQDVAKLIQDYISSPFFRAYHFFLKLIFSRSYEIFERASRSGRHFKRYGKPN